MPTDTSEKAREELVATIVVPRSAVPYQPLNSVDEGAYPNLRISLARFDRATGDLVHPVYGHWLSDVEPQWLSVTRAVLANGLVMQLSDDFRSDASMVFPRVIESLARGSSLAAGHLRSGLAGALQPSESFARGGQALVCRLQSFRQLTKDWPEFEVEGFPQVSIDRAVEFLGDVWSRASRRGRAVLTTGFCGPSEDGAVNCQWRRADRFLGLTVPPEGQCEVYLADAETGEDVEGPVDAQTFAGWFERF